MGEGIQAAKLQVSVESNALTVSGEVQQLNQSVSTVGKEGTENLGKLTKGFNFMQSEVLPAIGIVTGFAAGVKKAYEFGEEGAQIIELSDESHKLATSMGSDMDLIVAKVQAMTLNTIKDDEIMSTTSKAMLMGLGADADQMANLAEIAALRGRLAGESAGEAFDSVVSGIGRLSSRMLTSMGIVIDEQAAYETFAQKTGVAADSLSEVEKRQALLNAVLEDGNRLLKEQGGLIADDSTKYQQAAVAIDDAMDKIKTKFAPFWADVAQGLAGVLTYQDQVRASVDEGTQRAIGNGTDYEKYLDVMLQSEVVAGNINKNQVERIKTEMLSSSQSEILAKRIEGYQTNMGILNKTVYEASQIPLDSWAVKLNNDKKALDEAKDAATNYSDAVISIGIEGKLRDIQQDFNSSVEDLNKNQADLDEQRKRGQISLADYTQKTEENKQAHDDLKKSVNDNVKAFIFEQASAGLTGDALYQLAHTMGMLDDSSYAAAQEQEALRQQFNAGKIEADEYALKTKELSDWIASLQSKNITITTEFIEIHKNVIAGQVWNGVMGPGAGVNGVPNTANGMDAFVPSGYANDNYLLQLNVQSGERVQVTPAGQTQMQNNRSGGDVINIYPANANFDENDLDRKLRQSRLKRRK